MATVASGGALIVELRGDKDLYRKLQGRRADAPVGRFLDRGAFHLQGKARKNAPKDTGRLGNSIGTESPNNRLRSIGSNLDYAEPVEKGTRPHYPPIDALWGWAKRKGGLDPFAIQQSIGMWGTEAQPYLGPAAEEAEVFMISQIPTLAAEIESAFQ